MKKIKLSVTIIVTDEHFVEMEEGQKELDEMKEEASKQPGVKYFDGKFEYEDYKGEIPK